MPNRWRRRCILLLAGWLFLAVAFSFHSIRAVVAYPLMVHDADASGDAAYVMADGYASYERLRAASDLYHMKCVPRIIVLDERRSAGYNFVHGKTETRVDRVIDYLLWHGVPKDKISTVYHHGPALFGSLSESRAVAEQEPDLDRIVVVTSAPHTRRSRLCFRRSLPDEVEVMVYSASDLRSSDEIDAPIWLEYVKLVVYYFVA